MNSNEKPSLFTWSQLFCIILLILFLSGRRSTKSYNSEVYSSWEEEQINRLQVDVANLYDELEKRKY